jgi:hypothetical protein
VIRKLSADPADRPFVYPGESPGRLPGNSRSRRAPFGRIQRWVALHSSPAAEVSLVLASGAPKSCAKGAEGVGLDCRCAALA